MEDWRVVQVQEVLCGWLLPAAAAAGAGARFQFNKRLPPLRRPSDHPFGPFRQNSSAHGT